MTLDQNTLNKIRNYGALKYTADRICVLLGLDEKDQDWFLEQMEEPGSRVRKFYDQGVAIGEYNQDVELAKQGEKGDVLSIIELSKIQFHRKIDKVKNDLFGV
ncbi:MAG: hypothetical protein J7L96_01100 [Bacteroidales bacterium]|nr:hypothetical protein [Bacteroidales bacterium]